ncbi:MAG: nucleotidyltransferase family protein [Nitrospiraceae bacterium]|nr:nucleotidyltransferase family protein [Nitrospiraceae bacterium]
MGRLKQLLPLGAKPAIALCLDAITEAGISDIVVVLGPEAGRIKDVLSPSVKTVLNKVPQSEMAESVRIGLSAVDENADAVLVCLADHPLILPATLKAMITAHCQEPAKLIIPRFEGKKGHPCLFPGHILRDIYSQANLRQIIASHPEDLFFLDVADDGVVLDMDTEADYEMLVRRLGR